MRNGCEIGCGQAAEVRLVFYMCSLLGSVMVVKGDCVSNDAAHAASMPRWKSSYDVVFYSLSIEEP